MSHLAELKLPHPVSAHLSDVQEFEVKRTMSGSREVPKNRFSENKRWTISWENISQAQLQKLTSMAQQPNFPMRDPLGRSCVVKPVDFRPYHVNRALGPGGALLSGASMDLLVLNANHALYAPKGRVITTPANDMNRMPTLSQGFHRLGVYGGNATAFGPVLLGDLNRPPENWNRSARRVDPANITASLPVLRGAEHLSGATGTVYLAFETSTGE